MTVVARAATRHDSDDNSSRTRTWLLCRWVLLWMMMMTLLLHCSMVVVAVRAKEEESSQEDAGGGAVMPQDDAGGGNDQDAEALETTTTAPSLFSQEPLLLFSKGLVDHLFQLFVQRSSRNVHDPPTWWQRNFLPKNRRQRQQKGLQEGLNKKSLGVFNLGRRLARVVSPGVDGSSCQSDSEKTLNDEDDAALVSLQGPSVEENGYSGMILQVYRRIDDNEEVILDNKEDYDGTCLASGSPGAVESSGFSLEVLERAYALTEPVQLDLGAIPRHYLDYAYTPVVGRDEQHHGGISSKIPPEGENEYEDADAPEPMHRHTSSVSNAGAERKAVEEQKTSKVLIPTVDVGSSEFSASFSSWWSWWFPHTSNWWKSSGSTQSDYDMGKSAFAGGSHGEVWKGRRICRKYGGTGSSAFLSSQQKKRILKYNDEEDGCDDQLPLVLKRLRIDRGYRLLEAGLREVYFGNLIQEQLDETQKNLYTVYVDHFFREVPRRMFGRVQATTDLELWIVFEDAGPSLRSYLYTATASNGFLMYQHSALWTQFRIFSTASQGTENSSTKHDSNSKSGQVPHLGRKVMRVVLYEILSAAAILHQKGIVHKDIKPSNVMCKAEKLMGDLLSLDKMPVIECRLGDFSSAWDRYTSETLYTNGPSPGEQTDEYAPPESFIGPNWIPFASEKPQTYDSWSIGVLILELLLGTPNVFTVDQRTSALLTHKMGRAGASDDEITHALYLAALSQFCIYVPSYNASKPQSWPLRDGDPLHRIAMAKDSCTLQDFHRALRARDPLGIGFDSSTDLLLHLVWQLLAWDPNERMTAQEALQHPYFTSPDETLESLDLIPGFHNALESQMLDPRMDFDVENTVKEFVCPKCGRAYQDWSSCHKHANLRKHAKFCTYDHRNLPTCINAHSLLPEHSSSGYCDLQGRRPTIEDFHSIHLYSDLQFYGIFDGHSE
jgi:serine/threonine protein kinase